MTVVPATVVAESTIGCIIYLFTVAQARQTNKQQPSVLGNIYYRQTTTAISTSCFKAYIAVLCPAAERGLATLPHTHRLTLPHSQTTISLLHSPAAVRGLPQRYTATSLFPRYSTNATVSGKWTDEKLKLFNPCNPPEISRNLFREALRRTRKRCSRWTMTMSRRQPASPRRDTGSMESSKDTSSAELLTTQLSSMEGMSGCRRHALVL